MTAYQKPPEKIMLPNEQGAPRLIETHKTYRIPHEGTTALFKVVKNAATLSLKNLETGKTVTMPRTKFLKELEEGRIYVSAVLEVLEELIRGHSRSITRP